MNHFIQFNHQVCLITGAGSETGIGFSTAEIIGQLGGKIALISTTDRIQKRVQELEHLGIDARGYVADLMDRNQVEKVIIVSNPGEAAYSAAKAALIGMSRAIAIEVAKDNIMINSVLPGGSQLHPRPRRKQRAD